MKRGLILINAYSKAESGLNQPLRLKEEFGKLGVCIDIKRNDSFLASVDGSGKIQTQADYDFCVYLDKDKYISHMLERTGLKLFNSHFSIQACDDKMTTAILLANQGVPMPETLGGLLCYDSAEEIDEAALKEVERRFQVQFGAWRQRKALRPPRRGG